MRASELRFDRDFFLSQVPNSCNGNDRDSIATILASKAEQHYKDCKADPVSIEHKLCASVFYGLYMDMIDRIGALPQDAKVLGLGEGTGGQLMFYPHELRKKLIALDMSRPALRVLSELYPDVEEYLAVDMHNLEFEECSPAAACIGANTLYYATGEEGLNRVLSGIDGKLTATNNQGEKYIVHLFTDQLKDSRQWGGEKLDSFKSSPEEVERSYQRYFPEFKESVFNILEKLGYRVMFSDGVRFKFSDSANNVYQRALISEGHNAYEVCRGRHAMATVKEAHGRTLLPNEFLEVVYYDMLLASKKD